MEIHSIYRPVNYRGGVPKHRVGGTPIRRFASLSAGKVEVWAKLEWLQAGGSIKARAADNIIRTAISDGTLSREKILLDASSGNTAIAYATLLRRLGYGVLICLPSNASSKRIETLKSLGADITFTSSFEGTEGAQAEAWEIYRADPDRYFYADQYSNPANWQAHYHHTAPEILHQTRRRVTHFVAGLGTTGTFTGVVRRLREAIPGITAVALQPNSPLHGLEGWKHLSTAAIPAIYDDSLVDSTLSIDSHEAYEMIRFIWRHEGIRISPSSAANLIGAQRTAASLKEGCLVTVLPDDIARYDEVALEVFGNEQS